MAVWQAMEQAPTPDSVTDREQGGAVWQYGHMVIPLSIYNFLKLFLRSCHGGRVAVWQAMEQSHTPDSVTDREEGGAVWLYGHIAISRSSYNFLKLCRRSCHGSCVAVWQAMEQTPTPDSDGQRGVWDYVHMVISSSSYYIHEAKMKNS